MNHKSIIALECFSLVSWCILLAFAVHTLVHFASLLANGSEHMPIPHATVVIMACLLIIVGSFRYLLGAVIKKITLKKDKEN
ncbi:hypothetical protein [Cedecea neteri]|uniref:Uncharacterized protein n=1 Tax=Cedecea neteri TaxID=158822 RepID=A0A291E364_9ENTR|nr:hypothetical protein [Cedecea neteri]ATF94525.1 hypothetical protein CO704_21735 [Cedecea neteri]